MRTLDLIVIALGLLGPSVALAGPGSATDEILDRRVPVVAGPGTNLSTNGTATAIAARGTAGPDSFALYGGPGHPTEGKFQTAGAQTPDWGDGSGLPRGYGGGAAAWRTVDRTRVETWFHRSSFNAANLNGNGEGNHAMWCGVEADDPRASGWQTAPGYGNEWDDWLLYESAPVSDWTAGQVVELDFWFNHDTEHGYDFFSVEYDSAGTWTRVYQVDGCNADESGTFPVPGVRYGAVAASPIRYVGYDYGGDYGEQIRIRLRVTSDGAWSDEDGMWNTWAGAVQLDDISLTTSEGSFSEDFEGSGPYLFEPIQRAFAGDYADVYPRMTDLDPCRENTSPVAAFIDVGQIVRNGPGTTGLSSTGGATSPGIVFGVPGNYVVNYNGGLSQGERNLTNEIWSPDIAWDLDGPDDDDAAFAGAVLRFDVLKHLPLGNGIFYLWHVRSAGPNDAYGPWMDRNFVYYGGAGAGGYHGNYGSWFRHEEDVSDLLEPDPERVQVALACWDYASVFGFPGTAATPSPAFDNVTLIKYRMAGPTFATRAIDTAQDGFPPSGSIDVSSQSARDALDIPFSMARDVNSGDFLNVPGDSVIVDVDTVIPATTLVDLRMVWALATNPLFEDAIRSAPARDVDENVIAGAAGSVWTGEVVASPSTTSAGTVVDRRYFFDLPDVDFIYPGDVLHYYFQATDSDGRVSTMPHDTSGFADVGPTSPYARAFRVRGLPSLTDAAGSQPVILVYNDFGRRGGEAEWHSAFAQLGYQEGIDYDSYTVQGPTSEVSNGIGSAGAHGATSAQLAGYEHIFHFTGDITYGILSDGIGQWLDKGNDIATLRGWLETPGTRNIAHFGDAIVSGNTEYPDQMEYVSEVMGVDLLGIDVAQVIGSQTAPLVVPAAAGTWADQMDCSWIAYGGCTRLRNFDQIQPLGDAEAGHYFADASGTPIDDPFAGVASVIHPLPYGKVVTIPMSQEAILGVAGRAVGLPARAQVFAELLGLFGASSGGSVPVGAPPARAVELSARPNPFNPSTVIEFTAAPGARGSVRVYNLRGELVRTLHEGEFLAQRFAWDGSDDRGASVASGVYVVRAEDGTSRRTTKVALVK